MKRYAVVLIALLLFADVAYSDQYSRKRFKHWSDFDRNGLDTRQEMLLSQSFQGIWVCPYTGEIVTLPSILAVDHIVPLSYAWKHGADKWTDLQREIFANDPDNLLVVKSNINSAKGDKAPNRWIPPNISFAQRYIAKVISICRKYELSCEEDEFIKTSEYVKKWKNGVVP